MWCTFYQALIVWFIIKRSSTTWSLEERKNPKIEQAFRVLSEIQPHSLPFGHTKYRHVRASIRDGVNEKYIYFVAQHTLNFHFSYGTDISCPFYSIIGFMRSICLNSCPNSGEVKNGTRGTRWDEKWRAKLHATRAEEKKASGSEWMYIIRRSCSHEEKSLTLEFLDFWDPVQFLPAQLWHGIYANASGGEEQNAKEGVIYHCNLSGCLSRGTWLQNMTWAWPFHCCLKVQKGP